MKKWIIIIVGLLGIDQLSKYLVAKNNIIEYPLIKNFLEIDYTRNSGLVFGMFPGATSTHTFLLALFALIALGIFSYMFAKNDFSDKKTIWYSLALSLLIAGTLGNAIDRLLQPDHSVIDFILFRGFNDIFPYTFNFADAFLNVGLVLLFIDVFFLEKKRGQVNG